MGKNEKNLARYFSHISQSEASICPGKFFLFLFQTCGIENWREALTFSKWCGIVMAFIKTIHSFCNIVTLVPQHINKFLKLIVHRDFLFLYLFFRFCVVLSSFRISIISGMFSFAREAWIDHTFLNEGTVKKCASHCSHIGMFCLLCRELGDWIQKLCVWIAGSSFCRGASLPDGAFKQVIFLFTLQQSTLCKCQLWLDLFRYCHYVLIQQCRGFLILSLWVITGKSSWRMHTETLVEVDILPVVRQLGCTSFF